MLCLKNKQEIGLFGVDLVDALVDAIIFIVSSTITLASTKNRRYRQLAEEFHDARYCTK